MATSLVLKKTGIAKTAKRKSDIAKAKAKLRKPGSGKGVTFCIYARNKIGKTQFACSSDLKTLVIDCNEQGDTTVRHYGNVTVYDVGRWEELDWIFWLLKSGEHDFEVVVIDTITTLAVVCMKWVLKDDQDRDFTRDALTPDKRSWGKLGESLKDIIIKFRNLKMEGIHVIFLAQEKVTTSEDDDGETTTEVHPELSPSPRSTLLSAVDVIGRMFTKEVLKKGKKTQQRRMLLGTHPKYVAGNRYKELKYVEVNPTLGGLLAKISGEG